MGPASIAQEPSEERPRSVTIIGWTFLVLALLRILVDSLSCIVWKVGNAEPVVAFFIPRGVRGVDELALRHLPSVLAVQGTVAAAVAFIAYRLLSLRAWARRALEVVCGIAIVVAAAIAVALSMEWRRLAAGPESNGVAAVVVALLALSVVLGRVIWTLRRPMVRRAFHRGV
jgi:hypothetical protein